MVGVRRIRARRRRMCFGWVLVGEDVEGLLWIGWWETCHLLDGLVSETKDVTRCKLWKVPLSRNQSREGCLP